MRTVTEWRVTGDPTTTTKEGRVLEFPPYLFVWKDDQTYDQHSRPHGTVLTAEQAARRFAAAVSGWKDGPHLHKRTVTYSDWEEA